MWMFLVQEIMFFGGLFTVYLVFRSRFPIAFATGSNHSNVVMGFANTLVLIVSSLTMALTVYFAQKKQSKHADRDDRPDDVVWCRRSSVLSTSSITRNTIDGLVPVAGWNRKVKGTGAELRL